MHFIIQFVLQWLRRSLVYGVRYVGSLIFAAWSSIIGWLLFWAPVIVINLLKALGVGYVAYELGDFGLNFIYEYIEGLLSGLSQIGIQFLKLSGILDAISIIFGALSARVTYAFLKKGRKTMAFLA